MSARKIFAIADLHLSFAMAKPMDIFGTGWIGHPEKIAANWRAQVDDDDLVLIAGDISWAMKLRDITADFAYLRALPGHKIFIRGNHDYWWDSLKKNHEVAGEKFHFIHNNAVVFEEVAITGSRLWNFPFIRWDIALFTPVDERMENRESNLLIGDSQKKEKSAASPKRGEDDEKICANELNRLRTGLMAIPNDPAIKTRIAMTHFPPLSATPLENPLTQLLADFQIDFCVYGHLHALAAQVSAGNCALGGTRYLLTSADYLNFSPLRIQ